MFRSRQPLITCSILILLAYGQGLSQQSKPRSNSGILDGQIKRLLEYEARLIPYRRDLLRLAESSRNSDEFEMASDCSLAAEQASDRVDAAHALLSVYHKISSRSDRASVKPFIEEKISQYAQDLDIYIERLNLVLSHSQNADMKTPVNRVRVEIREIKTFLQSIKLA